MEREKQCPQAFCFEPEEQQHRGKGCVNEPIGHAPTSWATHVGLVGLRIAGDVGRAAGQRKDYDRCVKEPGVVRVLKPSLVGGKLPEEADLVAF